MTHMSRTSGLDTDHQVGLGWRKGGGRYLGLKTLCSERPTGALPWRAASLLPQHCVNHSQEQNAIGSPTVLAHRFPGVPLQRMGREFMDALVGSERSRIP